MKMIERLIRLIYPPRCVSCGEIVPLGYEEAMCPDCKDRYVIRRERECPLCLKMMYECECTNQYLERHSVHRVGKVFHYEPRCNDMPENQLVFRLKRANSQRVIRFSGEELAPVILRMVGDKKDKFVLVGAPRSHSAIRKHGYDHVTELCKELSKRTGIPYVNAVKRIGHSGQQKHKERRERLASAVHSYAPRLKYNLKGKRVIIVDDVITTGATVAACAKAVRACGCRVVLTATLGMDYRYEQLLDKT